MQFICYPKCTTCAKAQKDLDAKNISYTFRDIKLAPPTIEELKQWHKISGVELKKFFNTSGLVYKSLNLKEKLPTMTEEEQYQILSTDGMLVKRPLLVSENQVIIGYNKEFYQGE